VLGALETHKVVHLLVQMVLILFLAPLHLLVEAVVEIQLD
jgi:hypothetical protein